MVCPDAVSYFLRDPDQPKVRGPMIANIRRRYK
jgi:hypothetical protein